MVYYPYEKFVEDVKQLVRDTAEYDPDTIIGISRLENPKRYSSWMIL